MEQVAQSKETLTQKSAKIRDIHRQFGWPIEKLSKLSIALDYVEKDTLDSLRGHLRDENVELIEAESKRLDELQAFRNDKGRPAELFYQVTIKASAIAIEDFEFIVPGEVQLKPIFKTLDQAQKVIDGSNQIRINTPSLNSHKLNYQMMPINSNMKFYINGFLKSSK